jgi:purine-binding chemotaxis protein CheW
LLTAGQPRYCITILSCHSIKVDRAGAESESPHSVGNASNSRGVEAMPHESLQVLVFEVEGQRYALPAADVQELVRAVRIVPLPRAPAVVEGIINLRGQVIPVLDVRARFRLPSRPLAHTDHFIVARAEQRLVALHVDRALDLVNLDTRDVQEARSVVPGVEYVSWVARLPQDLVLIHDLRTFLSQAEADSLAEALPDGQGDSTPPATGGRS